MSDPENTQNVKNTPNRRSRRDPSSPDIDKIFIKPLRALEKVRSLSHNLNEQLVFCFLNY